MARKRKIQSVMIAAAILYLFWGFNIHRSFLKNISAPQLELPNADVPNLRSKSLTKKQKMNGTSMTRPMERKGEFEKPKTTKILLVDDKNHMEITVDPTMAPATAAPTPRDANSTPKLVIQNNWYGWQPETSSTMECSWRECFKDGHNCPTCRDEKNAFLEAPTPPDDWIPDVTMLRRMFLEGKDAKGNPWPPSLDDELCERIGPLGGKADGDIEALDTTSIVAQPFSKVSDRKLLCLVYTMEQAHATHIRAIRETWASGCDGFLAFSTKSDPRIPAISIPHKGKEDYENMWQKVRSIWKFVGKHYINEFDWFFLGGEDMFVMPQNLKNYLGQFNSSDPYFIGRRFQAYWFSKDDYFNGGGPGYALSKPTLQCFLENIENRVCAPNDRKPMEDVLIARCLRKMCNIHLTDTRDDQKRERFHPFSPGDHYNWKHPKKVTDDWYAAYNIQWGIPLGKDCCAPDSVSFHYITQPAWVRHLFHYLHGCKRNL